MPSIAQMHQMPLAVVAFEAGTSFDTGHSGVRKCRLDDKNVVIKKISCNAMPRARMRRCHGMVLDPSAEVARTRRAWVCGVGPQVIDVVRWEGYDYLVLERVYGTSLRQALIKNPRGAGFYKAAVAGQLIGLAHHGIYHGDLNPDNIIFGQLGDPPKIIDYGVGAYASRDVVSPSQLYKIMTKDLADHVQAVLRDLDTNLDLAKNTTK